jgi:hypothetical protein
MTTGEFLGFYGAGVILAGAAHTLIKYRLRREPVKVKGLLSAGILSWIYGVWLIIDGVCDMIESLPINVWLDYVVFDPIRPEDKVPEWNFGSSTSITHNKNVPSTLTSTQPKMSDRELRYKSANLRGVVFDSPSMTTNNINPDA